MCQTTNSRSHLTNISYHRDERKLKPFPMYVQKPAQSQLPGHSSHRCAHPWPGWPYVPSGALAGQLCWFLRLETPHGTQDKAFCWVEAMSRAARK